MQALDPAVAAEMRREADEIAERQASTTFTKQWMLGGKKEAIVAPGAEVVARLLPRWDFANSIIVGPNTADGKPTRIPNPDYKPGKAYVKAFEHAWQNPSDGKWVFVYCPKTFDPNAHCSACRGAVALIATGDKTQKDMGYNLKARRVYIYNAVIDNPRRVQADGLADIRIVKMTDTLQKAILLIMTGGNKPEFGRGDVTHPVSGYDLLLTRPPLNAGQRWAVNYAPDPSRLYEVAQAAAFKNWPLRMVDLDKMLKDEVKDSLAIFRLYMGREPKPGEMDTTPVAQATSQTDPGMADDFVSAAATAATVQPTVAEANEAPDDEFMPTTAPAGRAARR